MSGADGLEQKQERFILRPEHCLGQCAVVLKC